MNITRVVDPPGVLENDQTVKGREARNRSDLTAQLASPPAQGTLLLSPDGGFSYTPALDFSGTDSFSYVASDGVATTDETIVTLTVAEGSTIAPTAQDDAYSLNAGEVLTVAPAGVLKNDQKVTGKEGRDRSALVAVLVSGVSNGTLALSDDGSFSYEPAANFVGTDSFTYNAYDGVAVSNTVTVTLTVNAVNSAPVGVADSYATDEDTALAVAAPGVLGNDTDADGDPLTATLTSTTSNGTLVLNADGSFSYTPSAGFSGTDSFTYNADDGVAVSNTVTVTIIVDDGINDPPTISGTPPNIVIPGDSFVFTPTAFDPEGDLLTFSGFGIPAWAVFDPSSGTISGMPQVSDIGVYPGILIGVTDGEFTSLLGPFELNVVATTGTAVTVTWLPPTANVDDSPLLDLTGYKFHYWNGDVEPTPQNTVVIDVPDPGLSAYVLDLPAAGFWKIAMVSYNSTIRESPLSNVFPVLAE